MSTTAGPLSCLFARMTRVPDATGIESYLQNLFGVLGADPVRGRELLARFVASVTPWIHPRS